MTSGLFVERKANSVCWDYGHFFLLFVGNLEKSYICYIIRY